MQDNNQRKLKKKTLIWLIAIIIISIGAGLFSYGDLSFLPNWAKKPFRLGLDLSGGTHLLYEADVSQIGVGDRSSTMTGLRDVIERRVNLFGVSEPRV